MFDFENYFTDEQLEELYKGQTGVFVKKAKEFISQRLKVLEDEISAFPNAYVMILLRDEGMQIRYYGVDAPLDQKMIDSISQDDFDFLTRLIWEAIYPGRLPPTN